jgi:hypothetical protein
MTSMLLDCPSLESRRTSFTKVWLRFRRHWLFRQVVVDCQANSPKAVDRTGERQMAGRFVVGERKRGQWFPDADGTDAGEKTRIEAMVNESTK